MKLSCMDVYEHPVDKNCLVIYWTYEYFVLLIANDKARKIT